MYKNGGLNFDGEIVTYQGNCATNCEF